MSNIWFNRRILPLPAIAIAAALSACGPDDGSTAACDDPCLTPPAPSCDGNNRITYLPFGECVDGQCSYAPTTTPCEGACVDGACVEPSPCDGVVCDAPPADTCDGETAITWADSGTCNAENGECDYAESRTDCAADNLVCVEGRCVPSTVCDDVTCDAPPADTCEDETAVDYPDSGACDTANGDCVYTPTRTDCAAIDLACVDGQCVEPELCDGVVCERPPNRSCDGTLQITYSAPGTCDPSDGTCNYPSTTVDCAEDGLVCIRGNCVPDPACADVTCDEPPAPSCDDQVAVTWPDDGTCSGGECTYASVRTDCAADGRLCVEGACVEPCDILSCQSPPPSTCINNQLIGYASPGTCADGICEYEAFVEEDCPDDGRICRVDRCIPDPCAGVTCGSPPANTCDGDRAVRFTGIATCNDGRCNYERAVENCAEYPGGYCFAGACESTDPCFGLTCDAPPAPFCDGDVLVTSSGAGVCTSGRCVYTETEEDCAAEPGGFCFDGACGSTDLCVGVTCNAPPAPVCNGDNLVTFSLPGSCDLGRCRYARRETSCAERGQFCFNGACRSEDPCLVVSCDTPPPPTCDGNVLVRQELPGACIAGGTCDYTEERVDCGESGRFCVEGACVEQDPCVGTACNTPPASYCDDEVAIRFASVGDCALGECTYDRIVEDCSDFPGGFCVNGACRSFDPCFGKTCDTPSLPVCDGDVAVSFANPGVCVDGDCEYVETRDNCAAYEGGYCFAGACASTDPCFGVTCDEIPGPVCDGDRVVSFSAPGVCDDGRCRFVESTVDCATSGRFCFRGACTEFDPCLFIECQTPPATVCEGNVRVSYADSGVCSAGVCDYDELRTDCAAGGQFCFEGECQDDDPCFGVACTAPPAAVCDGDVAQFYQPVGVCAAGACEYTRVRQDCRSIPGGFCFNGACDSSDPCFGVDCSTPPAPVCDRDTVVTYLADGDCLGGQCVFDEQREACGDVTPNGFCVDGACQSTDPCFRVSCDIEPPPVCEGNAAVRWVTPGECLGGQCVFEPVPTDCTAQGRICVNGACVPPNPCNGVLCNTPPAPFCDGNTVVVSVSPGVCTSGSCGYAQQRIDCAAQGRFCSAGTCRDVDPCAGVSCTTPPAPTCRGTVSVEFRRPGQCIEGDCNWVELRSDCAIYPGGSCVSGACEIADPCDGVTCSAPPAPICDGTVVVAYALPGVCENGGCDYVETRADCADSDAFCFRGACVPNDPCEGVSCAQPPQPFCDADVAITFASPGLCQAGTCFYSQTQVNCAARGERCENGACIAEPGCSGVICQTPPAPTCDGEVARRYAVPGECRSGSCGYSVIEEDCAAQGRFCANGFCQVTDPCLLIPCDEPPGNACRGNVAVRYNSAGICEQGECSYTSSTLDCSLSGRFCVGGACRTNDPCTGVSCDTPAEPACDGTVAITYTLPGTCALGSCSYVELRDDCASEVPNGVCFDGACASGDPCAGRTCNSPPAGTCDGNVAVSYVAPGVCALGNCTYGEERTNCSATGRFCFGGRCQSTNPCQGVRCNTPPEPTCAGDTRVSYETAGFCDGGVCRYNTVFEDCRESGEVCFLGECIRDTACDGPTCTSPPESVCDGNIVRGYASPGECLLGNCSYEATAVDCRATSQFCYNGACQNTDPCAGNICALTPPDRCEDTVSVQFTGVNTCSAGVCSYGASRTDCAASGRFCVLGECVVEDPCAGLSCSSPPRDTCIGNTARSYTESGTCSLGACDYDYVDTDCTALGQECFGGRCAAADPCVGVVCDTLPPPICDGDIAISYLLPGACYGGDCLFGERRANCSFIGRQCVDGACVLSPIPAAGELVVTEFLANPSGTDSGKEWFEIYNRSGRLLDLSGVRVRDNAPIPQQFLIPDGTTIGVEGTLLIAQSSSAVPGGVDVNWGGATVFSLDNTADAIILELGGIELDRVEYGAGWPLSEAFATQLDGLSLNQLNDDPTRWCVAVVLYDGLNRGSPDVTNDVCVVDLEGINPGDVVITEIMANPEDRPDTQAEWLELYNATDLTVSISGMTLATASSIEFTFGAGTRISPRASLVVQASSFATSIQSPYIWPSGFSIADSSDVITLRRGATEIDRVSFSSATWPVVAGRSLSLDPIAIELDNNIAHAWCVGIGVFNPGGTDLGTPAGNNYACPAFLECSVSADCTAPAPYCEGQTRVSFTGSGLCSSLMCNFSSVASRTNCAASGQLCVAGVCLTP